MYAQRALNRMVKGDRENRQAAIEMLSAVKALQFGGNYQEDGARPCALPRSSAPFRAVIEL